MPMLAILAFIGAAQPGQVIGAWGSWAAIDRESSCEAVSRSPRPATAARPAAVAGFRFVPDRRQWGQFHVALGRPARAGSSVILDLGGRSFLLVTRGADAWSRGTAQDQAIIEALRRGGAMKVRARDQSGRRFSERFEGRGAATAIDSAAARCALRGAGKIR